MYIYLKIDNICGIDKGIKIDFLAEPRKRNKRETVVEIEKGKNINKLTGILGCNASGKSSIIKSIMAIDMFLKYNSNSERNQSEDKERRYYKRIEELMPKANVNRKDEYSVIELCAYIENCSKPGIYTYRLEYTLNHEIEIKTKEKLTYKCNLNSTKEEKILDIEKKRIESEIGLKYNYKDSFIQDIIDEKAMSNFEEKLEYYKCFYEYIDNELIYAEESIDDRGLQYWLILSWIEEDKETLEEVVKLIDKTIEKFDIEIVEGSKQKRIYYYNKSNQKLTFYDMSNGTRKFLSYIYLLLITLNNNGMILIDEIENSLHNDLVKFILKLVTIRNSNSQIIFTTNDQYTMDEEIMRIDQMYYLEKDNDGKTELKRFSESIRNEKNSNNVRNDETIRKKFKEKSICRGFQPSSEKIDLFINSIENRDILKKYIFE